MGFDDTHSRGGLFAGYSASVYAVRIVRTRRYGIGALLLSRIAAPTATLHTPTGQVDSNLKLHRLGRIIYVSDYTSIRYMVQYIDTVQL